MIIFAADLAASISCESFTPTAINSTLVYLLAKKATSAESIPPEKETVIFFSQSFLTAFSIACSISKFIFAHAKILDSMRFFNSLNAFLAFASLTMSVITATPDSKRIKLASGSSTRNNQSLES